MAQTPQQYYDAIADKYDWFYASWDAASEEQRRQLTPLLRRHGVQRVLDCACGNGLQAIALAQAGFSVTASDLSAGMLEQARRKSQEEGIELPLIQADIRQLRTTLDTTFDAVICMGNVLPHLIEDDQILAALQNMRAVLRPGGLLVLEGRYYDELVRTKERFIPHRVHAPEGGKSVTILYVLDHFANFIRFNIVFLTSDDRGNVKLEVDSVDYRPLVTDHLSRLIGTAGFDNLTMTRHDDRIFCTAQAPR